MIGRVLYRESVHGVLNYVLGKQGMTVLGYQNTCSENLSQRFFGDILHFRGQRNASRNRYAHITLNLPYDDRLENSVFYEVAKDYMAQMGYGEQPYVVVRHNDTRHEHVHIVSTNVNASGTLINTSHPYRRNVATQRYLEKRYGLSPSPPTKRRQQRELPVHRSPELQFSMDDGQGTRFYLQDTLNSILQKYKVRSFGELAKLAEPYHIEIRQTKSESGRIGVAYGLNNRKGYRTRFINGSAVHRRLSGPKLQKVFDAHSRSKLLPMHRKRLLKQIETTYDLFKAIQPNELANVLKEYQGIDIKLEKTGDTIVGYIIYDKSGYMFTERELGQKIRMEKRPDIFGNGNEPTEINTNSKQFKLEVQKLIKESFQTSYLKSPKQGGLLSEHIKNKKFDDVLKSLTASKNYLFLDRYIQNNRKVLFRETIKKQFPIVKERLYQLETGKEKETLENKFKLIRDVLKKDVFNVGTQQGSVRLLFQALGVKYNNDKLSFTKSNKHTVPVNLGKLPFPKAMESYVSSGFVRQNHLMLEMLTEQSSENSPKLTTSAIFLPMIFPKLYEKMNPVYKKQYESVALGSYVKNAERMHTHFEKSAKDYIALFNAKGFYFVKGEEGFEVKSIYTDIRTSCPLPKRTSQYLSSIPDLASSLNGQQPIINDLVYGSRNNLKNLWVGHLMERGMYDKVAFMLTAEKVYPNLHREIVQHHMENGLRKSINKVSERRSSIRQNRLLRKGVYAISSLLGNRGKEQEEVYNGFKDEFTDFSKYKGRGLSI